MSKISIDGVRYAVIKIKDIRIRININIAGLIKIQIRMNQQCSKIV